MLYKNYLYIHVIKIMKEHLPFYFNPKWTRCPNKKGRRPYLWNCSSRRAKEKKFLNENDQDKSLKINFEFLSSL